MNDWEQLRRDLGPLPARYLKDESFRCDDCWEHNRSVGKAQRRRARHKVVYVDTTAPQQWENNGPRPYQRCYTCWARHTGHPATD
jgi:hypothetical protein